MSWENNAITEGIKGEDIEISQSKPEQFQDYTDPMAVCDIKLEKNEIGGDHDTKNEKDNKLKKKRKIVKPEPSQCTECGKTFKNKTNMTQHIKFVHEKVKKSERRSSGKSAISKSNILTTKSEIVLLGPEMSKQMSKMAALVKLNGVSNLFAGHFKDLKDIFLISSISFSKFNSA